MAEIVEFRGITTLDIPASRVLDNAPRDMTQAVVIGYDADGGFYFASSQADGGDVLWLLELAKHKLITTAEEMAE